MGLIQWLRERRRRKLEFKRIMSLSPTARRAHFVMAAATDTPITPRQVASAIDRLLREALADIGEAPPTVAEVEAAFTELAAAGYITKGDGDYWRAAHQIYLKP